MATTLTHEALRPGRADSVEPIRSLADWTVCPGCTGVCAFIAVDVKGRGAARHGPCQPAPATLPGSVAAPNMRPALMETPC